MDIIRFRHEERIEKIDIVKNWAKKLKGKDYQKFLMTIISACGVSKRTALEYMDAAFFELDMKRGDFK